MLGVLLMTYRWLRLRRVDWLVVIDASYWFEHTDPPRTSTIRSRVALAHICAFVACVPFPLPCLHLSDTVIRLDPSLDLSTAAEITPKAVEHIGLPVWRGGGGEIAWSPEADKLAKALGIQEGLVKNGIGWG